MKNYSSRMRGSSRRSSSARQQLLRWAVILFVAIGTLLLFRDMIGTAGSMVAAPIHGIETWFTESSATIPAYFRERSTLIEEIESLEASRAAESGNERTIERLARENELLRGVREGEGAARIAAGVIGRPPMMPYDVLLLDSGARSGVAENAVVYTHGDRAIGMVSRVYPTSALVTLFTAPGVRSSVYVYGPDIYTHARGRGGGVLEISVPQGIGIEQGDLVVIPTLESGIVGTVREVESEPTEPEQRAFVVSDTPLQSIRFVAVDRTVPENVDFETAQTIVEDIRSEYITLDVPQEILVNVGTSSTSTPEGVHATTSGEASETPE